MVDEFRGTDDTQVVFLSRVLRKYKNEGVPAVVTVKLKKNK